MTRPHQLGQTLRTLKLSGMLDTLDTRLAQATAAMILPCVTSLLLRQMTSMNSSLKEITDQ